MTSARERVVGRRRQLPQDDVLWQMHEAGMTCTEIGATVDPPVGKQAVSKALRRIRQSRATPPKAPDRLLPWEITDQHQRSSTILMALKSVAKQDMGQALKPHELSAATRLREIAMEMGDRVAFYTPDTGITWRRRRPSDGAKLLVVGP